jgi:hypothetical protein
MGDVVIVFGTLTADLDGRLGQVTLVVAEPQTRMITHVVVVPDDVSTTARLVPIDTVVAVDEGIAHLSCSRAQFLAQPTAVSYEFASNTASLDGAAWSLSGGGRDGTVAPGGITGAGYPALPAGALGLGRDQTVRASDGPIGRLIGVGGDLDDHRLKSVVVAEGHLLTKRNVSFEIDVIMEFAGDVRLNLTRRQAEAAARPY